jgi:YHS domain-containing protein
MKYLQNFILIAVSLYSASILGQAEVNETALRKKHFNIDKSNLALQGYDAVSYFSGSPQKGSTTYSTTYKGILYRFSSSKNLDLFKASPAKYEPAYGGWCAYAMGAKGEKVEVDPETYKIINGRLYLFYNSFFNNTKESWDKDEKNLNKKADLNWIKIYK